MFIASAFYFMIFCKALTKPIEKEILTLLFLGVLYPFGKFIQFHFFFPSWLRWHLADIGFIPFWTLLSGIGLFSKKGGKKYRVTCFKSLALKGAFISAIFALGFEFTAMLTNPQKTKIDYVIGDWIDTSVFIVMLLICILLIQSAYPKMINNPFWKLA